MNFNDVAIICIFAFIGYLVVGSVINMLDERKSLAKIDKTADADSVPVEPEENFAAHINITNGQTRAWYEVLAVSETATLEQIKEAYKRQMSQYHPDKVAEMAVEIRDLAEMRSKEINAAYEQAIKLREAA
jgi:DnaJ-domain-containing protein 1